MALIIEDGTVVANANSYVTLEEYRAFALARGVVVPAVDADAEVQLIEAMDYLEAQRSKYQGHKTDPAAQLLQFPRTGVVIDCNAELGANDIPVELKQAQMRLAMEVNAGNILMPTSDGRVVKREKVDVIEREFMTGGDNGNSGLPMPSFPAVDALLAPLFAACGGGFGLRTVRV